MRSGGNRRDPQRPWVRWRGVLPSIVLALAVCLAANAQWVSANQYLAPDRPLSPDEMLTCTIAHASAIAVGRFISYHDTTVERGLGSGLAHFRIARLRPGRWLRGDLSRRELRIVVFGREEEDRVLPTERAGARGPELNAGSGRVIVCLDDAFERLVAPRATFLGAAQSVSRWVIYPGEPPYEVPGTLNWTATREAEVRREIRRQLPDSLLTRADVIAIARPHSPFFSDSVTIVTALSGTTEGANLRTRLVLPFMTEIRKGRNYLLLLRRARDEAYEPVSLRAGVVLVEGDRVPAWNCTIADVRARIERIAAARAR